MLTPDQKGMKATQTKRTYLELLGLIMSSGLMLLAAFSMIVQMDTEMNALEVNAPIVGQQLPTNREDPTPPMHGPQQGGLEGYVGGAAVVDYARLSCDVAPSLNIATQLLQSIRSSTHREITR